MKLIDSAHGWVEPGSGQSMDLVACGLFEILFSFQTDFKAFLSHLVCRLIHMRREVIPARSLPRQRIQPDRAAAESTDVLAAWLVGIETDISRLEQNRVVVLSEFDSRDGHHVYGHPSTISFLKEACRMSGGRAKRLVKTARAAAKHAATMAAWRFGQLSTDQAQQLFDISHQLPDRYENAEQNSPSARGCRISR